MNTANTANTAQGYPLVILILSLLALTIACDRSEPGRTSIFVRAPTGTTEAVTLQPGTQAVPASSTSIPVPTVTPTPQTRPAVTDAVPAPAVEPSISSGEPPEPTPETLERTPAPSQTTAPVPTTIPPPTTQAPEVSLVIECIFFDGLAIGSEADEYVQILNQGDGPVNLMGWRLQDVSDGSPELIFPAYELAPLASVRAYTNEIHPESGGFSFQRKSSIWNNSIPDTAGLFNPDGLSVSTKSYPPGC